MKDSDSDEPPLVIGRDVYEALLKDPYYGRLAQIGVEIGSVIVKDTHRQVVNDTPTTLPKNPASPPPSKRRAEPQSGNDRTGDPPCSPGAPRFTLCGNCGTVSGRRAKYCDECGTKLPDGTKAPKQEFTLEFIIEMMRQHPLAGIVLCSYLCEGEAKLDRSPLLQKYLEERER